MLNICDLSSNNSLTQRLQAIAENDGVISKATEGASYNNPGFTTDLNTALEKGKVIGAYHYARAELNTAETEALHFLKVVRPYISNAVLCLDWEGKSLRISPQWARDWLDIVYQITGVKPIIYMSESVIKTVAPYVQPGGYGLWVAKYSSKKPTVSPWAFKALWQYTSSPYDKSYFYGNSDAWHKYAKRS